MWSYAWADEKFELLWGSRPMGSISAAADQRPAALRRLGGDEVSSGEVQTHEATAQRQASAQERAPTDPSMRA